MVLRVTTWNVNGIRNPFSYQPWRDKRTFDGMFDILEADIVIMQELKIQRKDLRDDMVLVPGWDCYFSLPRHKKGYSGVGIYTRNAVCAPIKAEEGLLGFLCPPNSTVPYRDLPEEQHIGGYPTEDQLENLDVDAATLDAEGRCMILEFPAFVLFGIYAPANSSGQRDDFRYGFHTALDLRVRNLTALGKRIVVTGDLNVSRTEIDTANAAEAMRKEGLSHEDYMSTPNRRIFNQLLDGGDVIGERDKGREKSVLWDTCREFHPHRKGMYTHWEQKINARPGNFGSRIDFILCSLEMKSWFSEADIQEGLMGSDHCPVFAVLKDQVTLKGREVQIKDIMNPMGTFKNGQRVKDWTTKNLLPASGRLLTEFDKRRTIKDMFGRNKSSGTSSGSMRSFVTPEATFIEEDIVNVEIKHSPAVSLESQSEDALPFQMASGPPNNLDVVAGPPKKRPATEAALSKGTKKVKPGATISPNVSAPNGQKSLKGFFKSSVRSPKSQHDSATASNDDTDTWDTTLVADSMNSQTIESSLVDGQREPVSPPSEYFVDPIVSKESWDKLFTKPTRPRCEHGEPCQSMKTKVKGINCGRDFWMCAR